MHEIVFCSQAAKKCWCLLRQEHPSSIWNSTNPNSGCVDIYTSGNVSILSVCTCTSMVHLRANCPSGMHGYLEKDPHFNLIGSAPRLNLGQQLESVCSVFVGRYKQEGVNSCFHWLEGDMKIPCHLDTSHETVITTKASFTPLCRSPTHILHTFLAG